ncbi:SCO3242 family prenyltransferase [Streptomyces sp. NPDC002896]|uniref:SCO3242 family prenyltransferase n=1 Tax=Streptomyces sp. NPDC002896 TaxID=3154438 RepID=UPI00331B9F55
MSPRVRAGGRARAWAELLRLPALFTVPGDALAGAAAAGARPDRRTLLAIGSSLCLYEAGMALNDWADRADDAVERPHRPLPSGRISPVTALAAAGGLTIAGLAVASRAGRPALAVAGTLATTVWAYDLGLKRTAAGPVAMAAARGLDLALGAAATVPGGRWRGALPSATVLGAHTLAVTAVSRREAQGGSSSAPLAALATTLLLAWTAGRSTARAAPELPAGRRTEAAVRLPGSSPSGPKRATAPNRRTATAGTGTAGTATAGTGTSGTGTAGTGAAGTATAGTAAVLQGALGAAYAATAARPLFHAALNPSPPLTQQAVGAGIRAMIPLQAALAARGGGLRTALLTAVLAPAARSFARKVSVT